MGHNGEGQVKITSPQSPSDTPVYCDYNATSPLRPAAREAMLDMLDHVGNASSIHSFGRAARQRLEKARQDCLEALGLPNHRLVFTSGATEALATCLRPGVENLAAGTTVSGLLIASTEHVAALDGHGFAAERARQMPVDGDGRLASGALAASLDADASPSETLVCVQGANNETGVLQPVDDIARLCRDHGALFACDLVQWAGRLPAPNLPADIVIVSAHKIGGPSGVGTLIYDPARVHFPRPLVRGGGQERGVRGGTENLVGAVGFAAALDDAAAHLASQAERLAALRDGFEAGLKSLTPEAIIFAQKAPRLPNTSSFAIPGREAALALMQLDLQGVAISSGSACSSGKVTQSHVLAAMGVEPAMARCALRVSFGFSSTDYDVARLLSALEALSVPA